MEQKKKIKYVLCKYSLKDLENIVGGLANRYDKKVLYSCEVDVGDITPEQKKIQYENKWYAESSVDIRTREGELYEKVEDIFYGLLASGCRTNIKNELFNQIMDTKVVVSSSINENEKGNRGVSTEISLGEPEDTETVEYSYNIKEYEENLKSVRYTKVYGLEEGKYVMLENVGVYVYPYSFNKMTETVLKLVKRFIRLNLSYCITKDKIIVPEEYLARGKEGIKEWREIKASKNKNNSIEKRILRQTVKEKKSYANRCMSDIMHEITKTRANWKIPSLEIDGRWNKQKTTALVNQILNSKNTQFYIDITEEEIANKFKNYWKETLMEACDAVDKMIIKKN